MDRLQGIIDHTKVSCSVVAGTLGKSADGRTMACTERVCAMLTGLVSRSLGSFCPSQSSPTLICRS